MLQDEAGFGRISMPKYCWHYPGLRPVVPSHHIREYRCAYGAVEPLTGDSFFLVLPYTNTIYMDIFLQGLSDEYKDNLILLACDKAAWHTGSCPKPVKQPSQPTIQTPKYLSPIQ